MVVRRLTWVTDSSELTRLQAFQQGSGALRARTPCADRFETPVQGSHKVKTSPDECSAFPVALLFRRYVYRSGHDEVSVRIPIEVLNSPVKDGLCRLATSLPGGQCASAYSIHLIAQCSVARKSAENEKKMKLYDKY